MKLALALLAISTCPVSAQPPTPANLARTLLKSQDLREKSWGAWYAGASHDTTLAPTLIAHLKNAQSLRNAPRDREDYAYVQSLFDALIQLAAPVPTAIMMPFENAWRSEILILMNGPASGGDPLQHSRPPDPDRETALLEMRSRLTYEEDEDDWTAINDLLFDLDPKIARETALREIEVTHQFCISDQPVLRADDGSAGFGLSNRHFPKGFPPIALYRLRTLPSPGDSLFLNQPIATYYARLIVPTDAEVKWLSFSRHGSSTSTRQWTLARLLAADGEIFHPWTVVDWQGTEKTGAAIAVLLDRQEASIRSAIKESGIRIPIAVAVRDCRRDRLEPLPQVPQIREIVFP